MAHRGGHRHQGREENRRQRLLGERGRNDGLGGVNHGRILDKMNQRLGRDRSLLRLGACKRSQRFSRRDANGPRKKFARRLLWGRGADSRSPNTPRLFRNPVRGKATPWASRATTPRRGNTSKRGEWRTIRLEHQSPKCQAPLTCVKGSDSPAVPGATRGRALGCRHQRPQRSRRGEVEATSRIGGTLPASVPRVESAPGCTVRSIPPRSSTVW